MNYTQSLINHLPRLQRLQRLRRFCGRSYVARFRTFRPSRKAPTVFPNNGVLITPPGGLTPGLKRRRNQSGVLITGSESGDYWKLKGSGIPGAYPHPRGHGSYHAKNLVVKNNRREAAKGVERVIIAPPGNVSGSGRPRTRNQSGVAPERRGDARRLPPITSRRQRNSARVAERKHLLGQSAGNLSAANKSYKLNPTSGNLRALKGAKSELQQRVLRKIADRLYPGKGSMKSLNEGNWIKHSRPRRRILNFG